jgi:hypothetical protein
MPRMKILNSIEQEAFELPPLLNSAERKRHFDFPVAILQIAAELRTAANQLCFLLGLSATLTSGAFHTGKTTARELNVFHFQVNAEIASPRQRSRNQRATGSVTAEVDPIVWAKFRRFLDGAAGSPGGGPKAAIHSRLDSALGSHPCVALSSYQAPPY